jgi:hypothetical protein
MRIRRSSPEGADEEWKTRGRAGESIRDPERKPAREWHGATLKNGRSKVDVPIVLSQSSREHAVLCRETDDAHVARADVSVLIDAKLKLNGPAPESFVRFRWRRKEVRQR